MIRETKYSGSLLLVILISLLSLNSLAQNISFYDLSALTIDGDTLHFNQFKGKKILVINTASECMLTPQYKKLQELYEEYGGDDFEIIAFPCNDFGNQEPGSNETIKTFCSQYHISFTLMAKISIKGEDIHPVYNWLTNSELNGTLDAKVKWNFQKFMIDSTGEVIDFVGPAGSPQSKRIIEWLNE